MNNDELYFINMYVLSGLATLMIVLTTIYGRSLFVRAREMCARFGFIKSLDLSNKARTEAKEYGIFVVIDHDQPTNTFMVKLMRYVSGMNGAEPNRIFSMENLQFGEAWLKAEELAGFYNCQVHVTAESRKYHSVHYMSGVTAC